LIIFSVFLSTRASVSAIKIYKSITKGIKFVRRKCI